MTEPRRMLPLGWCLLLGLFAVGRALAAPERDASPRACDLLSQDALERAYGVSFQEPAAQPGSVEAYGRLTICTAASKPSTNQTIQVALFLKEFKDRKAAFQAFRDYQAMNPAGFGNPLSMTTLTGLGEAAGWVERLGQLVVVRDRFQIVLMAPPAPGRDGLQTASFLAGAADRTLRKILRDRAR